MILIKTFICNFISVYNNLKNVEVNDQCVWELTRIYYLLLLIYVLLHLNEKVRCMAATNVKC